MKVKLAVVAVFMMAMSYVAPGMTADSVGKVLYVKGVATAHQDNADGAVVEVAVDPGSKTHPGTAVVLNTTSFGSITQDGFSGADQVEGITDQTSVTVTTAEHEVTFAFDGLDLTITQFDTL